MLMQGLWVPGRLLGSTLNVGDMWTLLMEWQQLSKKKP
jgi:hypothetical protein